MKIRSKATAVTAAALGGALIVGAGAFALSTVLVSSGTEKITVSAPTAAPEESQGTATPAVQPQSIDQMLVYLAEEEKLAHDVYAVLGDMWGDQIFTNIQSSEVSHQDQVSTLLSTHGISDPRSSEVGVFTNAELQALYDQLIAQGSQSVTEAYKVGVLIEETDIADLQESIAATSDPVILSTLNRLLSASQNHLKAFSRKI